MIHICAHCGRTVATAERIVHTDRYGWVPSTCMSGETGPVASGLYEDVANHPYWYCYVFNDGERRLLMGPYRSYEEAIHNLPIARRKASDYDYRADWYSYGVASGVEAYRTAFGFSH